MVHFRQISGIFLIAALSAIAAEAPAGTQLHIRLKTKIDSTATKPNQYVEAVVIQPVIAGHEPLIPAGVRVAGEVSKVHAPAKPDERACVDLGFSKLVDQAGKEVKIAARVVDVDNARETVDSKGVILGILASETLTAQIGRGIEKVEANNPFLGGLLQGFKAAFIGEAQTQISYDPGVEMTIELTQPAQVNNLKSDAKEDVRPVPDQAALYKLVNAQPFRTQAENPPSPSDITNLMFLGTEEQLKAAFESAGWTSAAKLNKQSGLEVFRAVAELRGYKEAPMSVLLLDGRKPDLVFQKQNNTFAKRHHLRIWKRPASFADNPVWVCAATHDIGIDFSAEHRTFIHKIDPRIDRERAKVVNDLVFTGRVKAVSLVERPDVPKSSQNATGDALETDGRMAVLMVQ